MLIKHYLEHGLSKAAIAERVPVSRRKVYHWIASGQLERPLRRSVRYPPRPTKLDPYKRIIDERLATYPELSAVRLYDEVRAAGYLVSLTQLKRYVHQVRPRPPMESIVRFETVPGQQGQVDSAKVQLPWGSRYAFTRRLGVLTVLVGAVLRAANAGRVVSWVGDRVCLFRGCAA